MPLIPSAVEVGLKRILVATDFSTPSQKALHHALALARTHGSKLYLANVVSSVGFTLAEGDVLAMAEQAAQRDMSGLEEELTQAGDFACISHETIVCCGKAGEQLKDIVEREHIDLVVMGTHGRTGISKMVMGSVAEEVLRHANCPVMTVGPAVPSDSVPSGCIRRIVFPTDFGAASRNALAYAVILANQARAQLVLLHVFPPMPVEAPGAEWYLGTNLPEQREKARCSSMEHMKAQLSRAPRPVCEPELAVAFDFLPEGIVGAASERAADLILMGVRAGTASSTHLPWSTVHEVICQAECPVLTLRS